MVDASAVIDELISRSEVVAGATADEDVVATATAGDEVVATAAAEEDDAADAAATDSVPLGMLPNEGSVSSSSLVQPVIWVNSVGHWTCSKFTVGLSALYVWDTNVSTNS